MNPHPQVCLKGMLNYQWCHEEREGQGPFSRTLQLSHRVAESPFFLHPYAICFPSIPTLVTWQWHHIGNTWWGTSTISSPVMSVKGTWSSPPLWQSACTPVSIYSLCESLVKCLLMISQPMNPRPRMVCYDCLMGSGW